jgi:4-hydroxy-tetrahydrodipicolinate synthase
LAGCGTALATPFTPDGRVDEAALRAFVEWQVGQGVQFVIPCGSTGEAATLASDEQRRVVELTVEQVNGRIPVVAGAGSNDTRRAIARSLEMRAAGASHLLHVTPMYNKPPQRALLAHFRAIADACPLPIVVYNVPGRTAVNLEARTALAQLLRERPPGFAVLSGDDGLTLPVMALGGEGVVSVVSNAVPALVAALCAAMARGDLPAARALDARLAPVVEAAFLESNPIPVKAMLAHQGHMADVLRLPLVPLADAHRDAVRLALQGAGALGD